MTNEVINELNIYSDAFNQIRDVLNEWDRRPFLAETAVQAVVNLIQSTTTENGLSVVCMLDENVYETGIKVTDENFDAIYIDYVESHHGGVYIIKRIQTLSVNFFYSSLDVI